MTFNPHSARKKRARPEARLQKTVVQYLMMNGAFFLSIVNEGERSYAMTNELKAMGMTPGAADLLIVVEGRAHFLELKSEGGHQSYAQFQFMDHCLSSNIPYECVDNITDALKVLSSWRAINTTRVAA